LAIDNVRFTFLRQVEGETRSFASTDIMEEYRSKLLLIRLLAIGIATEAGKALHLQFASITGMARPTILVAETELSQALSVRKLVLESAKYNVLTAHSTDEALDIFQMFPNVNVVVLVMDGRIVCELVARSIKQVHHKNSDSCHLGTNGPKMPER
jgi:hypothetical protein